MGQANSVITPEQFKDQIFSLVLFYVSNKANKNMKFNVLRDKCTEDNLPVPESTDYQSVINFYKLYDPLVTRYLNKHVLSSEESLTRFYATLISQLRAEDVKERPLRNPSPKVDKLTQSKLDKLDNTENQTESLPQNSIIRKQFGGATEYMPVVKPVSDATKVSDKASAVVVGANDAVVKGSVGAGAGVGAGSAAGVGSAAGENRTADNKTAENRSLSVNERSVSTHNRLTQMKTKPKYTRKAKPVPKSKPKYTFPSETESYSSYSSSEYSSSSSSSESKLVNDKYKNKNKQYGRRNRYMIQD